MKVDKIKENRLKEASEYVKENGFRAAAKKYNVNMRMLTEYCREHNIKRIMKKTVELNLRGDIQKYVNFIFDNDLPSELEEFETGFSDGEYFIYVKGNKEIIYNIKRLSMENIDSEK